MSGPMTAPLRGVSSATMAPRASFHLRSHVDFQGTQLGGRNVPTIYPHEIPAGTGSLRLHLHRGKAAANVGFDAGRNRWNVTVDRSAGYVSRSGAVNAIIRAGSRDLQLENISGHELHVRWMAEGQQIHSMPLVDVLDVSWELEGASYVHVDRIAVTGPSGINLPHGTALLHFDRERPDESRTGNLDVEVLASSQVPIDIVQSYSSATQSALRSAPASLSEYVRVHQAGWDGQGFAEIALAPKGHTAWQGRVVGHFTEHMNVETAASALVAVANHVRPLKLGARGAQLPAVDVHVDFFGQSAAEMRRFESRHGLMCMNAKGMYNGAMVILGSEHAGSATNFGLMMHEGVMGTLHPRDVEIRTRRGKTPPAAIYISAFGASIDPNVVIQSLASMYTLGESVVPSEIAGLFSSSVVRAPG